MKKTLKYFLTALLAGTLLFSSVACGSAFDGNYKEASEDEKQAVVAKLTEAVSESKQSLEEGKLFNGRSNKQLTIESVTTNFIGADRRQMETRYTVNGLFDFSDKEKPVLQFEFDYIFTVGDVVSNTIKATGYVDVATSTLYLDYYYGLSATSAVTAKVKGQEKLANLFDMATAQVSGELHSLLDGNIEEYVDNENVKVYVDGKDKIKLDLMTDEWNVQTYFKFNGNDYDAKLVAEIKDDRTTYDKQSTASFIGVSKKYRAELVSVNKKVTMPTDLDEYEDFSPDNFPVVDAGNV